MLVLLCGTSLVLILTVKMSSDTRLIVLRKHFKYEDVDDIVTFDFY